uniref:biotin/lipoyl-containing protein n=1 Tax=Sedimenticola sp. TaxID=1940285 RepID=UPI003D0FB349
RPGDAVEIDNPLITLESDKASMEIPSPYSGTVRELRVKVGDKVSTGSAILTLEIGADAKVATDEPRPTMERPPRHEAAPGDAGGGYIENVRVPDIGDFKDVDVIEVLVRGGDHVAKGDSLITLESDKASMEIPSPEAGIIRSLKLSVGDKVSEGALILTLEVAGGAPTVAAAVAGAPSQPAPVADSY